MGSPFIVIHPAIESTAHINAISKTATGKGILNMIPAWIERTQNYLAGLTLVTEMLFSNVLKEADYSALETEYTAKFRSLFRYEKPCFSSTLLIRQTGEGSGFAATNAEDSRQAPQACTRRSARRFDGRKEGRVIQ